jgi:hypothetical protein
MVEPILHRLAFFVGFGSVGSNLPALSQSRPAIGLVHRRTAEEVGLSFPTSKHFPFHEVLLFGFERFPLCAKAVDFVEHSLKKGLGRSRRNPCSLKLKNFPPLPVDLAAHSLDF